MILAAARNPILKKIIRESSEKEMEILTAFIQNLRERGWLRSSLKPSVLARAIFAIYPGLIGDIIVGLYKSEVRKTCGDTIRTFVGDAALEKRLTQRFLPPRV